jgi:hypothetical protein
MRSVCGKDVVFCGGVRISRTRGSARSVFQSVIAIELAVTGALLWQIRFFESTDAKRRDSDDLPDSRLRLGLALILGATVFGSLWAIADDGPKWAAIVVTVGLAVSLIPILLRVLHRWRGTPPLTSAIRATPSPSSAWFSTLQWSPAFSSCSACARADDAIREGEHHELGSGLELQLAHDVRAVRIDRAD